MAKPEPRPRAKHIAQTAHAGETREDRTGHISRQQVYRPDQQTFAKMGAWMKFVAKRSGMNVVLNQHEHDLMEDIWENDDFVGERGGQYIEKMRGLRRSLCWKTARRTACN